MKEKYKDINRLFSLEGKVALITGGSRGIGRMIAKGLLQAGAKVYISARNAIDCEQTAVTLNQIGQCIAIAADVAESGGRAKLCEVLTEREQRLNILINNAGTAWGESYENYPEIAFEKVMKINVTAVFALTQVLTPLLQAGALKGDPARVINIGSMDGLHITGLHDGGHYAYTASKAAVHHLTRHLAVELGRRNITVNAVAPGYFPSKMSAHLIDERTEGIRKNALIGRVGEEDDMAGIAIYLASRAGAYTHGTIIPVDGGTSINHGQVSH